MKSIVIVMTSMTLLTVVVAMMVSTIVVIIMMVTTMTRRREECHCPFPENLLHLLFSKKKRLFCPILHPFSISRKSLLGQSEFKAFVFSTAIDEKDQICQIRKSVCRKKQHCRLIITILDCDPTCSNERVSSAQR